MKRILTILLIFVLIIVGAYIATILDINPPQKKVRPLGRLYLFESYYGKYSAKSPEVVTSIVWDYRGLDTIFEVTVFFLAIMGGLTIFRIEKREKEKIKDLKIKYSGGLTIIVKIVTKLLTVMIVAVSASIALHGHLTPGGGFQGGTALAIAPLLILVAYSREVLEKHGLTYIKAVLIRSVSLLCILVIVFLPFIHGYYLLQNQPFYPVKVFGQLISGSLFFYNFFDYIAIGMGFTAIFLYLSIPEKIYRRIIEVSKG
ncbi:MAG: sodium:proton antiporter [Desulfurococcales archaeon ex4484_58]|nr:MAG: sodium:proton antiporter [Desulfurococcales archaeon ex4484_58]